MKLYGVENGSWPARNPGPQSWILRVREKLWRYQTMRFKGKFYALPRLDFGLNRATRIIFTTLRRALSLDLRVQIITTDHYIDDIIVKGGNRWLRWVFSWWGEVFEQNSPRSLRLPEYSANNRTVLEVRSWGVNEKTKSLCWMKRHDIFFYLWKIIGTLRSWLRFTCNYIKRSSKGSMRR